MGPERQGLIKSRLGGSDKDESCSSLIVGHALHYKPSLACAGTNASRSASRMVEAIKKTCFKDAVNLVSPASLCDTHAQYLVSSFVWLNLLFVATTVVLSEWYHYYDDAEEL